VAIGRFGELIRFEMLAAGVSHVWLMIFLGRALEPTARTNPALLEWPLLWLLVLAAVIGIGLAGLGIALNDALDARHDRAFAPQRPIPAGRVSQRAALGIALVHLLLAVAAAVPLGGQSTLLTLATAGAIVFYNLTGRFLPAIGIVMMGLVQALVMTIPNPRLAFAWPLVLAMTHVIGCEAARYHLAGKRPRLSSVSAAWLTVGWFFWSLLLVAWMTARGGLGLSGLAPSQQIALAISPFAAMAAFVAVLRWLTRGMGRQASGRELAGVISRVGMLWLIVYDAAWLAAAGLGGPALLLVGLLAVTGLLTWAQRWLVLLPAGRPRYRVRLPDP
jgi:4-hydroxybenzoate polyprenyltransferase